MTPSKLEQVDNDLKAWGTPLRYRPLEAFKRLHGVVSDVAKRAELFDPIVDWYISIYGEEARWDGILGRFPIIIRNMLYLGIALWGFENKPGVYKEQIEGLPKEISDTFNDDEFRDIAERLTQARASFIMLHDLNVEDHFLKGEARDLLHMAMKDLDSASSVLKHASNVQGSIVFSGKYPRMQGILCLP